MEKPRQQYRIYGHGVGRRVEKFHGQWPVPRTHGSGYAAGPAERHGGGGPREIRLPDARRRAETGQRITGIGRHAGREPCRSGQGDPRERRAASALHERRHPHREQHVRFLGRDDSRRRLSPQIHRGRQQTRRGGLSEGPLRQYRPLRAARISHVLRVRSYGFDNLSGEGEQHPAGPELFPVFGRDRLCALFLDGGIFRRRGCELDGLGARYAVGLPGERAGFEPERPVGFPLQVYVRRDGADRRHGQSAQRCAACHAQCQRRLRPFDQGRTDRREHGELLPDRCAGQLYLPAGVRQRRQGRCAQYRRLYLCCKRGEYPGPVPQLSGCGDRRSLYLQRFEHPADGCLPCLAGCAEPGQRHRTDRGQTIDPLRCRPQHDPAG